MSNASPGWDSARAVDPDQIRRIIAIAEANRRKAFWNLVSRLRSAARSGLAHAFRLLQMKRARPTR
jgi:hypothetical protein